MRASEPNLLNCNPSSVHPWYVVRSVWWQSDPRVMSLKTKFGHVCVKPSKTLKEERSLRYSMNKTTKRLLSNLIAWYSKERYLKDKWKIKISYHIFKWSSTIGTMESTRTRRNFVSAFKVPFTKTFDNFWW